MANKNLLKKIAPVILSATVAMTGMPSAAFAAEFSDEDMILNENAEDEGFVDVSGEETLQEYEDEYQEEAYDDYDEYEEYSDEDDWGDEILEDDWDEE